MEHKRCHKWVCRAVLFFVVCLFTFLPFVNPPSGFAQPDKEKVELNGDVLEYNREKSQVMVQGNVVIKYKKTTLFCDKAEFYQEKNTAKAYGNVRLVTEHGELRGNELTFDYNTMTGDFMGAKILAYPYYGGGEKLSMEKDNKIVMTNGYLTTSDYDKPEYRIASKRIEVYPGDKVVAHGVQMKLSDVSLMYLPRFWHRIDDTKPKLLLSPGYDSDWGMFLLSQYRFYSSSHIKGTIHLDYRELLDVGSGADFEYKTDNYGTGMLRTYFTHERKIDADRIWDDRLSPTKERDRYKIEWRHKWILDERTTAIAQYYKLSDHNFLKDYFEREFEEDSFPDTFFLMTHSLPRGTLSLRSDVRVNRFVGDVERLPELRYDLNNTEIYDSGFYFKNVSSFVSLVKKDASPSEVRESTKRVDTDYEISYPMKAGIFEVKPFVGGRETFYTRTEDADITDELRQVYRTGASLSTKFYKIYDLETDTLGLNISRLRHIITPSINYEITTKPTLLPTELNSFDEIDELDQLHNLNFSVENKLQTKRGGETVELLRTIFGVDYRLAKDHRDSGFDTITADVDFRPNKWLTLYFDSDYDTRDGHMDSANFDMYINGGPKWTFGLGKRYSHDADDQITTDFIYKINPKWAFRNYVRVDVESGQLKEQEYTLTRDLHSWIMDLKINDTTGDGTEFLLLFRLKAFPEMGFDFGTTFERKQSGSDAIRQ